MKSKTRSKNLHSNKDFFFIIILLIGIFLVGYFLGTKRPAGLNFQEGSQLSSKNGYEEIDTCGISGCLFIHGDSDYVVGFAKVKGYYRVYEGLDWGDTSVTCKSLVVTGGSQALINHFRKMIEEGNSINEIDKDNNLLMNINLDTIPVEMRQKIIESTVANQVELGILRPDLPGRGANKCFSFVEIISVD